ncbi:MAG: potassium transporter TrkG [Treponema sp.]|uniref:TrkH family potassium uptake protein n=1 Tax=Treponema sp. TaxID=166 RepID=UPI002A91731B|nr:potassium transporter TrkG [Treponema sp.]MDY6398929.1 potassium transporter TrkG [Treponema sp.]
MQFFIFARLIFIILAIVGLSLVFPILTALSCGELSVIPSFAVPLGVSVLIGVIFYFAGKKTKINFSIRNVFAFVALAWISISVFGSVPLLLSGVIPNFYDALFESVSGFSTTGATILSDVESIPRSINFWRCQMHWLGGMGIIALTVALLPLLGVGSFQLIKAESTGPEKGQITPKMANTAKTLWLLYVGFTVAHAIALKICGMDVIDSICHAFSTLGTGGFSSKNASIGAYNSLAIEIVCTVFMFLAGVNFSLYFYVITGKFDEVKKNSELKAYISLFLICIGMITLVLVPHYGSFAKALRYSSFQVASVMTTTGYATDDFTTWPNAAQFFIFLLFFTGGCSGSTSGGFKIIRWVVLKKQAKNEMLRMLHPHGVFTISLNDKPGRKDLVFNVAAFTFVYFMLVMISTMISTFCGLDIFTSFTASLSMTGSIGPAFGKLNPSQNFGIIPPFLKYWYCFVMIAGRLELYNLIIFLFPDYWKK